MDREEERLRAELRRIAPGTDDTDVLRTVLRKGRALRRRRRALRGAELLVVAGLVALVAFGVVRLAGELRTEPLPIGSPTSTMVSTTVTTAPASSVVYENDRYGFTFTLPNGWDGYKIVEFQWEGFPVAAESTVSGVFGPEILIRHPLWTATEPRQDIPIMVFTLDQWSQVEQELLSVSAAPIPPTELGRNSTYVFALPPRYNFAYPTGYEEVDTILKGQPLRSTQPQTTASSSGEDVSSDYELTAGDSGRSLAFTVTSRFSLVLDGATYPPAKLSWTPPGVIETVSNAPQVDPPLQAIRFEAVNPGTCTIKNGDFSVTIVIVPPPD